MSAYAVAVGGGLLAMFGWGLADFFAKVSVDALDELTALVSGHVVATLLLVALAAGTWDQYDGARIGGPAAMTGLALLGILQGVIYLLLYKGFGEGDVSRLSPVFASFSGIVALTAIAFLGDRADLWRSFALVGVFGGVILLSATDGVPVLRGIGRVKGFRPVGLATLLAAGWTVGWSEIVRDRDPIACAAFMYGCMTVLFVVFVVARKAPLRVGLRAIPALAGIGMGEAAAYAGISWGYEAGSHTSVVALLSGAFSLPTMLLAAVFLHERLGRLAIAGGALVVIGTSALAMF
ncbi:hypothetical protein GCM10028801_35910 [Nocardioides maradonensis]